MPVRLACMRHLAEGATNVRARQFAAQTPIDAMRSTVQAEMPRQAAAHGARYR